MVGGDFAGGHEAEEGGEEFCAVSLGAEHSGAFVFAVDVGFLGFRFFVDHGFMMADWLGWVK